MRIAVVATFTLLALSAPRAAQAQRENGVHVFSFVTKSYDRQSEAIAQAIRAEVRAAAWTPLAAPAPFSLLMLGQKCPPVPDNGCLVRISDQLKVSRFVWGSVDSGKGGLLTVQAHVWENGKGDSTLELTIPEGATDSSSSELRDAAKKITKKLLFKEGTLVLKTNVQKAQVYVDGQEKGKVEARAASIDLGEGGHEVQVRAQGAAPMRRRISIRAGETTNELFTFALGTSDDRGSDSESGSPAPVEKSGSSFKTVAGVGLLVLGAGGLALGIEEAARWSSEKDSGQKRADAYAKGNWGAPSGTPPIEDPCSHPELPQATESCRDDSSVRRASILSLVGFGVGAVAATAGVYLLVADSKKGKSDAPTARISPVVGPGLSGGRIELQF